MALPRGAREAAVALATATLVLLAAVPLADTGPFRRAETASLDLRFRLRGVRPPGPETAIMLIDDATVAALGRWPFDRRIFARAVDALDAAGAKLIVFDLLFADADQPVPADLRVAARDAAAALSETADPALRASLERLAASDPDAAFATAIRRSGRVLMPIAFSFDGAAGDIPDLLAAAAFVRFERSLAPSIFPLEPVRVAVPVEPIAVASAGLGHVNWAYDRDGAPRYDYAALPFAGDFFPSLALRTAAAYLDLPWTEVGLALGEGARLGEIAVPTDAAMRLVVNYRGPRGTFPTFSFIDLVEGRVPADRLRGRIVLIGASFLGLSDALPSPFGPTELPGTERIATVVDQILRRDFVIERPPGPTWLALGAALLLAAATGLGVALVPTRAAPALGVLALLVWSGGVHLAFLRGLWLPMAAPFAAIAAASLAALFFHYSFVDREARRVRAAMGRYMAPAMVETLAAHPERLRLGGETRVLTILFSDVRGFTAIAERYRSNPQGLTELINRILTPLTEIVMRRRGTIDKYMGDCIMAFWNAPLDDAEHAEHACAAALEMRAALARLNEEQAARAAADGRLPAPIEIGIGLNTGACVAGNMGSEQRFDYSVIGDAVNLASRLEGQSKTLGVGIVIGDATRAAAPSWAALEIGLVPVHGRHEPARVHALLGPPEMTRTPAFAAWRDAHEALLAAFRRRDWAMSRACLAECRRAGPAFARVYAIYEARIADLAAQPPGEPWDGALIAAPDGTAL